MNCADITATWQEVASKPTDDQHWRWLLYDWPAFRKAQSQGVFMTAQQRCDGGFKLLAKRVAA